MKKILTIVLIIVGIFALYKFLSIKPTSTTKVPDINHENPDLVLYYGNTCPHCKLVEDYIESNQVDQKMKINRKEVYDDKQNQQELTNMVNNTCKELNQGGIGVPIALDVKNNKCIQGDQPIIDFIASKIGLNNK